MLGAQYSTDPLDAEERARVRRLQIACKAVKACGGCHQACGGCHQTCGGCHQTLPVHQFPRYGSALCEACAELPVLETWWAQQKRRTAAAS